MDIDVLTNLGPKNKNLLNKLNIYTLNDLLTYYPYRYNFITIKNINEALDEVVYINAIVLSDIKVNYIRKNFNILSFIASNNNINFKVTIYNRAFLKPHIIINKAITLIGKYDIKKNTFICDDIKLKPLLKKEIIPIYHVKKNIKNSDIRKIIDNALLDADTINNYIPLSLINKYNFPSKAHALRMIHNPINYDEVYFLSMKNYFYLCLK